MPSGFLICGRRKRVTIMRQPIGDVIDEIGIEKGRCHILLQLVAMGIRDVSASEHEAVQDLTDTSQWLMLSWDVRLDAIKSGKPAQQVGGPATQAQGFEVRHDGECCVLTIQRITAKVRPGGVRGVCGVLRHGVRLCEGLVIHARTVGA